MNPPAYVFVSYSLADQGLWQELEKHLAMLERRGVIRAWGSHKIGAGEDWRKAILAHLDRAHVILLLLSPDFFASDHCYDVEVETALAQANDGKACVIPIRVRPYDWGAVPFERLRGLPTNGKSVTDWPNHDDAWAEVAREIRLVVASLLPEHGPYSHLSALPSERSSALCEGPGGVPISAVPHFVGRDQELCDLRAALASDKAVCIVASGSGGIGKTSLVKQFIATETPAMFPDGSVWIDAMSLDVDAARACERFGYTGERQPTVAEASAFLAHVLHQKRVLVVIDNVFPEHFDVTTLPIAGGSSRTVITSRSLEVHETLGKPAQALVLGCWTDEACRAYLRKVVPQLASVPAMDLDALATFVGRLPLAVRLLARLLLRPGMTPDRLLNKLRMAPLDTLDKFATGADRGVTATFRAAYDELTDLSRYVLLALAACAPVTTEAVLACVMWLTREKVSDVLGELATHSLVELVDSGLQRWTLHDVVRFFVREQKGFDKAETAHCGFAERHVREHREPMDWQAMEAGMDEVLAAVDRLQRADDARRAASLLNQAWAHLSQRGRYAELVERYEELAARLPAESEDLAIVLGNAGLCFDALGHIPKAIEFITRASTICEKIGDLEGQAVALGGLGHCYHMTGDIQDAIECLERALALNTTLGCIEGQSANLGNLASCYLSQDNVAKAIENSLHVLAIDEKRGCIEGKANALANLGICYERLRNLPRAIEFMLHALALFEELGIVDGQARQLHSLGACYLARGEAPLALSHFDRAIGVYRRMSVPDHHPALRWMLDVVASLRAAPSS